MRRWGVWSLLVVSMLTACVGPAITDQLTPPPASPDATAGGSAPNASQSAPASASPSPTSASDTAVLLAAGDIVSCSRDGHEQTAEILDRFPDATVQTLGDNAYNSGTPEQFECYDGSWGRAYDRTRPALGGHDYRTEGAAGYMAYFADALEPMDDSALDPRRGWYAYDLAEWRIYVLNSICQHVDGGCGEGSPQEQWLRDDLAAHPTACVAGVIHNPRFSSGRKGNEDEVEALWDALYDAGAELVLSGDNHAYERLAPMNATGDLDLDGGVRQFVVGTGGRSNYPFSDGEIHENTEVGNDAVFGVLMLTLQPDGYAWEFLPVEGATFTDTGAERCH
jgi:acid phosphatase type 7